MNEFLANLYNTGGESDQEEMIEKMASAQVLTDIAAQQGKDLSDVDWDQLSTEDIHDLIKEASGEYDDEGDEDFQEKLAEWDFAGRTMAHAFYQEQEKIAAKGDRKFGFSPGTGNEVADMAADMAKFNKQKNRPANTVADPRRARTIELPGRTFDQSAAAMRDVGSEKLRTEVQARRAELKANTRQGTYKELLAARKQGPKGELSFGRRMSRGLNQAKYHVGRNKWAYGAGAAGAAALGLGYGAYKMNKNKNSSMLDELAAERAQEFLNEKTASYNEDDDVEQAIQQRAAEMLYEAGYGDLLD